MYSSRFFFTAIVQGGNRDRNQPHRDPSGFVLELADPLDQDESGLIDIQRQ